MDIKNIFTKDWWLSSLNLNEVKINDPSFGAKVNKLTYGDWNQIIWRTKVNLDNVFTKLKTKRDPAQTIINWILNLSIPEKVLLFNELTREGLNEIKVNNPIKFNLMDDWSIISSSSKKFDEVWPQIKNIYKKYLRKGRVDANKVFDLIEKTSSKDAMIIKSIFKKYLNLNEIKINNPTADIIVTEDHPNVNLYKGEYKILDLVSGAIQNNTHYIRIENLDTKEIYTISLWWVNARNEYKWETIIIKNKNKLAKLVEDELGDIIELEEIKINKPSTSFSEKLRDIFVILFNKIDIIADGDQILLAELDEEFDDIYQPYFDKYLIDIMVDQDIESLVFDDMNQEDKTSLYKKLTAFNEDLEDRYEKIDEDKIPGGLAQGKSIVDLAIHHGDSSWASIQFESFEKQLEKELEKGIKVEMEHTTDEAVAKEIAMDHLWEDPKYYDKLASIELEEIKINNPVDYQKIWDECWDEAIAEIGEIEYNDEGGEEEDEFLENEDEVSSYARELFKLKTGKERDDLDLKEIKINNPTRKFKPGEYVYYYKDKVRLSSDPDKYHKKYTDNDTEYYLIDDAQTGERYYVSAKLLTRVLNEISIIPELQQLLEYTNQEELNPSVFEGLEIIPKVREVLLNIAKYFWQQSELKAEYQDILLLGSSANYNWTEKSDIDVHILFDFKQSGQKPEDFKKYIDAIVKNFNETYDFKIKDNKIELYVQDLEEENHSVGVFSILNNKWLQEPKKEKIEVPDPKIQKYATEFKSKIDELIYSSTGKLSSNLSKIKQLKDKIKQYREESLDSSEGEYSIGNLVFKELRNSGYLQKLSDFKTELLNKKLSVQEIRINKPIYNHLKELEKLQQQIEQNDFTKDKIQLAIKGAELVYPIWEYYYPNDNRVKQTLESAKKGEYNNYTSEIADEIEDSTTASYGVLMSIYALSVAVYSYDTNPENSYIIQDINNVINYAIRATKLHFNLNEIKVNNPNPLKFIIKLYGIDGIDAIDGILSIKDNLWIPEKYFPSFKSFDVIIPKTIKADFGIYIKQIKDLEEFTRFLEGFGFEVFQGVAYNDTYLWINKAKVEIDNEFIYKENLNERQYHDKLVNMALRKDPESITSLGKTYLKNELKEKIKSLSKFLKKKLELKSLPKIRLINNDKENSSKFFGKTAYYDPNEQMIVLYTLGRHPKDITRSFSHEMVHYKQDLEGRLKNITTQNINEDEYLAELEREAYEKGNMLFRSWENSQKLNEIKINDPTIKFPLEIKSQEHWDKLSKILEKEGYLLYSGLEPTGWKPDYYPTILDVEDKFLYTPVQEIKINTPNNITISDVLDLLNKSDIKIDHNNLDKYNENVLKFNEFITRYHSLKNKIEFIRGELDDKLKKQIKDLYIDILKFKNG